jgi:hypothetical protein
MEWPPRSERLPGEARPGRGSDSRSLPSRPPIVTFHEGQRGRSIAGLEFIEHGPNVLVSQRAPIWCNHQEPGLCGRGMQGLAVPGEQYGEEQNEAYLDWLRHRW